MSEPILRARIFLANPRGFCGGVTRAVEAAENALKAANKSGERLFIRREIVHNKFVTERLLANGAEIVDEVDEVPDNATVMFSAHGVSPAVREMAAAKGLKVIDATCPLVNSVHLQVKRAAEDGKHIVYIGHSGHDEVVGVLGEALNVQNSHIYLIETADDIAKLPKNLKNKQLAWFSQTTLSVSETAEIVRALAEKFPQAQSPNKSSICYATTNRQAAISSLVRPDGEAVDMVIVVGSKNSSNTLRLAELAASELGAADKLSGKSSGKSSGKLSGKVLRVDSAAELRELLTPLEESKVSRIGITSGASVPEDLVEGCVTFLHEEYFRSASEVEIITVGGGESAVEFSAVEV